MPFVVAEFDPGEISFFHHDRAFRRYDPPQTHTTSVHPGLVAAGLLASELYVRHRAESVVAAATECVVQDKASVSFGATPLLLQLATGHYRNISIHTAGNRIGNARGMKADVRIDDVRLDDDADAKATVGALEAMITWSADGVEQSIQEAIPLLRGLVTAVQTNPHDGHHQAAGQPGQCHYQAAG